MTGEVCPPAVLARVLGGAAPPPSTRADGAAGTISLVEQLRYQIKLHPEQFWVNYLRAALARIEYLEGIT